MKKSRPSATHPLRVAVYCSSVNTLPETWQQAARTTGDWIGRNHATLVYGGVDAGLMRIVSEATKKSGGKIVGVVPMRRLGAASPLNDMQVPTSDLNDRKGTMQLLGDVFVVLPGGYGTLDEFTTSFSYINFTEQFSKSIILYNPDGIYDCLLAHLHKMVELGLMQPQSMSVIKIVNNAQELSAALDNALAAFKTL